MVWKIGARIDEGHAKRLDPGPRRNAKEAGAHVAASDVRLDDDIIAIGREDAPLSSSAWPRSRLRESGQMPILAPSRFGLTKPAGGGRRGFDQPLAISRMAGGRHRQAESAKHGAGAKLVLAKRKQRIVGADGLEPPSLARAGAAPPRK